MDLCQVVSTGDFGERLARDLGLDKAVLASITLPSGTNHEAVYCDGIARPLRSWTLFALQEFVYKCALFAERAHLLFNCVVFPSCVNLSLLSVIVNYRSGQKSE